MVETQIWRLLLIDDSPRQLPRVNELLGTEVPGEPRFVLTCVPTLEAALAVLSGSQFDAVLADLSEECQADDAWTVLRQRAPEAALIALVDAGQFLAGDAAQPGLPIDRLTKQVLDRAALAAVLHGAIVRRQTEMRLADLTAQLAAAERRVNELTGNARRFLDGMSHELRTPLAVIQQFVAVLKGPVEMAPAERGRYLDLIADRTSDLEELVGGCLDLHKARLGLLKPWRRVVPPAEVLAAALPALARKARLRGVEFQVAGADDLPEVFVDATQVAAAMQRIAELAIASVAPQGRVEVIAGLDAANSAVVLKVTALGAESELDLDETLDQAPRPLVEDWLTSPDRPVLVVARHLLDANQADYRDELGRGGRREWCLGLPVAEPLALAERQRRRVAACDPSRDGALALIAARLPSHEDAWLTPAVDEFLQSSLGTEAWCWSAAPGEWLLLVPATAQGAADTAHRLATAWPEAARDWPLAEVPALNLAVRWTGLADRAACELRECVAQELAADVACGEHDPAAVSPEWELSEV